MSCRTRGALIVWLVAVPVTAAPVEGQEGKSGRLNDLAWLAGCWILENEGAVSEEQWTRPSGEMMLGIGRTVSSGKTLWFEFLQIRQEGDSVLYTARPSGQEGAAFLLTSSSPYLVVFEAPEHDFPQRITYRGIGTDSLHATIEGMQIGSRRTEHFPFRRVSCD